MRRMIACLVLGAAGWASVGAEDQRWTVRESTAGKPDKILEYRWENSAEGGRTLVAERPGRVTRLVLDPRGTLVEWSRTDPATGEARTVRRSDWAGGDSALPWVQDMNQLTGFARGTDRDLRFVGLADALDARLQAREPTTFRATRVARETRPEFGSEPLWKVRVTFDDLRAAFWGADYWFRVRDGKLVAYREVRGGPGTPPTLGWLVGEAP